MRSLQPDASYNHLVSSQCADGQIFVNAFPYVGFIFSSICIVTSGQFDILLQIDYVEDNDKIRL